MNTTTPDNLVKEIYFSQGKKEIPESKGYDWNIQNLKTRGRIFY